jgi:putative phosphoribosyl transferase
MTPQRFADRADAGRQLAALLTHLRADEPLVLALPRGGVPVAAEVARVLGASLDVLVARKLGAPHQPEFGIGAIAEGGARVVDDDTVRMLGLTTADLNLIAAREEDELARRVRRYRGNETPLNVAGRTVVLVDDGLATGVTARAAVQALRRADVGRVVLAVPVSAPETAAKLRAEVDELVCVAQPDHFAAVGLWYEEFDQTPDEVVVDLLDAAPRVSAS